MRFGLLRRRGRLKRFLNSYPLTEKYSLKFLYNTMYLDIKRDRKNFFKDDRLNVEKEEEACLAMLQWCSFDPNVRKDSFEDLLSCIRLGLLTPAFFAEHLQRNNDLHCWKAIEKCANLCGAQIPLNMMTNLTAHVRPRVPDEIIVVHGGWLPTGGEMSGAMEVYDCRVNCWYRTCHMKSLAYYGCVAIGLNIYFIGGCRDQTHSSGVFDMLRHSWSKRAPMHSKRLLPSVPWTAMCTLSAAMTARPG